MNVVITVTEIHMNAVTMPQMNKINTLRHCTIGNRHQWVWIASSSFYECDTTNVYLKFTAVDTTVRKSGLDMWMLSSMNEGSYEKIRVFYTRGTCSSRSDCVRRSVVLVLFPSLRWRKVQLRANSPDIPITLNLCLVPLLLGLEVLPLG